ncbi:MAG TPA: MFS transporter [Mycobacteriales bacterium]|nr:MFS transporter [Mycobacteriales bacterium]
MRGPAVLQDRRFSRLVLARTISLFGTGVGPVALAFGVLGLAHASPTDLSIVQAAYVLPLVLFVLLAGAIADRRHRLRVLVLADTVGGLAWTGLALLIGTRHAPLGALVALAFVGGTGAALVGPTMTGVVPEMAPPGQLQQANSVLRLGLNFARLLGLAVGGALVAAIGAGWTLAIDAASFFASAVLIAGLGPGEPLPVGGTSLLSDLRTGGREFFSHQWLWVIVAQFSFLVAVSQASIGVLGPIVAKQHLGGAPAWSLIVAADALGALAGAIVVLRLRISRPLFVATLATLTLALPMLLLGLPVPAVAVAAGAFLSGVGTAVFGVLWDTTVQREIPPAMLSRVSSYDWLGSVGLSPIGIVVAGPLALAVGARPAELGCAAVAIASTLLALLSPHVRRMSGAATEIRKQDGLGRVALPEEV